MNCTRPECGGEGIIEDGYCNVCGYPPERETTSTTPSPRAGTARTTGRRPSTTRTATSARHRLGAGLVEIPPVAEHDPVGAIVTDAHIAEEKRYCPNTECGAPVGRSRDGQAGRTEGFCARCGTPFSFRPALSAGDLLGGQYRVEGCLAHGGLGWIYLARDLQVSGRWVVLKGLLNANDPDAMAAALAERQFLAEVDHNNIVKIHNFVEHDSAGYIVMEYVAGTSLRRLLEDRRAANDGVAQPLSPAHAIAYIVETLPAFAYLHRQGLLFCDFKPDNVMQTARDIKLIDLGGVYRIDDPTSAIYGTKGYQAPEIAETGPTVVSDLYTVGRTLAVLCTMFPGYQQRHEFTLPSPDEEPLFARYDSLYRVLRRATAPVPDDRFQSAEEFEAQLYGVLREIVAAETGQSTSAPSTLFTPEVRAEPAGPSWRALPTLVVDSNDPASGFLASLPMTTPDAALQLLEQAPETTIEVSLRRIRVLLEAERFADALEALDAITDDDPWEWRARWYSGLAQLAFGNTRSSICSFDAVYQAVPGELAPKVALGFAYEAAGRLEDAARWYDIVSRTDPTFTNAAFGLARCRLSGGDPDGALAAYERVPATSSAHHAAQLATAESLLGEHMPASYDRLTAAGSVVGHLPGGSAQRAEFDTRLFTRALTLVTDGSATLPDDPEPVLTVPLVEHDLRLALEAAYRDFARFAADTETRFARIDCANDARPRTLT
jgi:serine/threonine-protein kinase PknG